MEPHDIFCVLDRQPGQASEIGSGLFEAHLLVIDDWEGFLMSEDANARLPAHLSVVRQCQMRRSSSRIWASRRRSGASSAPDRSTGAVNGVSTGRKRRGRRGLTV